MTIQPSHDAGRRPELVAHRGYALRFPENTITALEAALVAGAAFLEFDVQSSADGIPVLLHDTDLKRTAGVEQVVWEHSIAELKAIEVNESDRLDGAFRGTRIPTVSEAARLLEAWPETTAFVEIKVGSLRRFGVTEMVASVVEALGTALRRCVIISFDGCAIQHARAMGAPATGWILDTYDETSRRRAVDLGCDYLFCDHDRLPRGGESLWSGPWQWALYEVAEPQHALELAGRGADLVETMAIAEFLRHPLLNGKAT